MSDDDNTKSEKTNDEEQKSNRNIKAGSTEKSAGEGDGGKHCFLSWLVSWWVAACCSLFFRWAGVGWVFIFMWVVGDRWWVIDGG
jgi:hypothetical protein